MDPRAIGAWALQEMSGEHAARRQREGNANALNIGYFDSGPGGLTREDVWSNPLSAARQTDKFLRGKAYNPSASIREILPRSQGKGTAETIDNITASNWATDPAYRSKMHAASNLISAEGGPATNVVDEPVLKDYSDKRWLVGTEGDEDLRFQRPLGNRLRKLWKLGGKGAPLRVNSGTRTYEEQAHLHNTMPAGMAAAPGTSRRRRRRERYRRLAAGAGAPRPEQLRAGRRRPRADRPGRGLACRGGRPRLGPDRLPPRHRGTDSDRSRDEGRARRRIHRLRPRRELRQVPPQRGEPRLPPLSFGGCGHRAGAT